MKFFLMVLCCVLGFTVLSAANDNAFAQDNNRTSRAAQLDPKPVPVLIKKMIATSSTTGRDHSIITVVQSSDGSLLSANAVDIKSVSKAELNTIRYGDPVLDLRNATSSIAGTNQRDSAGFQLNEVIDVKEIYSDNNIVVYQFTYSDNSQQVGVLNRATNAWEFGPRVGGS